MKTQETRDIVAPAKRPAPKVVHFKELAGSLTALGGHRRRRNERHLGW